LNEGSVVSSRWHEIPPLDSSNSVITEKLQELVGARNAEVLQDQDTGSAEYEGESYFNLNGEVYRLIGLVISDTAAATIVSEEGVTARLAPGESLPSGEKVKAVRINELEFVNKIGEVKSVPIYKR